MKMAAILVTIFAFSAIASAASDGQAGQEGQSGNGGARGASGTIALIGMKCVISTNLEHLQMCLDDHKSVNQILPSGESIFQAAILSRDLPMLKLVIDNPDVENKPDLRVRYTDTNPDTPSLNIYELILYSRAKKNQNWEKFEINEEVLQKSLYVDDNQVDQLKMVLAIETDKEALRLETKDVLSYLNASNAKNLPSVKDAIQAITEALAD